MRHDPTFWVLARASGMTAYVLLTSSVLEGLALKSRVLGPRVRPPIVTDIHRFLALLGLGAIALHGVALVLDSTVDVSPLALLLPGLVEYRPLWTALGVVAAELMLLVYVSFALRRRIGARAWRRLHWLTYAIFAAATAHGIAAGSDSGHGWAVAVYAGAIAAVAGATVWRMLVTPVKSVQRRVT
jgi:sulfoxide reductase heme-binding subunit YedZ